MLVRPLRAPATRDNLTDFELIFKGERERERERERTDEMIYIRGG